MRKAQLLGVLVTLVVAGGVADAGGHTKPKWCVEGMEQGYPSDLKNKDVKSQLRGVAYILCNPDAQYEEDPWGTIDSVYKQLSARFGFTDADWADVAVWSATVRGKMYDGVPKPDAKKPWGQLTPIEQYAAVENNEIGGGATDPEYFIDALGTKLSETGRMAWLERCLTNAGNRDHAVLWALCQADIEAWDPKKVLAEVKAATDAAPGDRMVVRLAMEAMKDRIAAHAGEMKKLLASDPVYGQMVDMVKKAHAEWATRLQSPSPSLDMLATVEDALVTKSRKAAESCHARAWDVLKSVISKIPAKQYEVLHKEDESGTQYMGRLRTSIVETLLNDKDGYAAATGYAMCWEVEPQIDAYHKRPDQFAGAVEALASRLPGARGPRTSAWTNLITAGLKPDASDAVIEFPRVQRPFFGPGGMGSFSGASGTVTKATPKGDKIHFEFMTHKVTWTQQYDCHNTNHIRGIMSNGEFDYEYVCKGVKEKTADEGPAPYDVNKETASVVKVHQAIIAIDDQVFAVYKDAKSSVPLFVLGQPVK